MTKSKKSTPKRKIVQKKTGNSLRAKPAISKKKSPAGSTKKVASKKKTSTAKAPKKAPEANFAAELLYGAASQEYSPLNERTNVVERVIERDEMESESKLREQELTQQYLQAVKAMKKVRGWIKKGYFGPDVGCTVGFRKKFGHIISPLRYVVEVHVPFKISERNLLSWPEGGPAKKTAQKRFYAVPKQVGEVLTKVIETRPYRTDVSLTAGEVPKSGVVRIKATKKLADISKSPVPKLSTTEVIGGLPVVETDKSSWGTFGIAYRDTSGSKSFGLINAHFANGSMVQPPLKPAASDVTLWDIGTIPSGKKVEGNTAGETSGEKFYVDAALIALNDKRSIALNLVQDFADTPVLYANSYLRHVHPHSNRRDILKKVFKFGARTLERIEGFIENPEDESVTIDGHLVGSVIRARRNGSGTFTLGGDSGSSLIAPIYDLVTGREQLLVVGLCFGGIKGDNETLYACQFAAVIQALGLQIPSSLLRTDWAYSKP